MPTPTNLSKLMSERTMAILDNVTDGVMDVECILYSADDPKFTYTFRYLNELDFIQDFSTQYTDYITLMAKVTGGELIDILTHVTGLRCRLLIRSTDRVNQILGKPILDITRKVIIKDQGDLFKRYSLGTLVATKDAPLQEHHTSNLFPLEIDLIDDSVYYSRKTKFNFIARDVTMEDILILVARILGFAKVHIVPPDNKKKYENFIIPPMQSLATFANYLQTETRFGVYDRGMGCYVTNGVLYIYPLYNNDIKTKNSVSIFSVAAGTYSGSKAFHVYNLTGDLHIISNQGSDDRNLTLSGVENTGNSFLCPDIDKVIDGFRVQGEQEFEIAKDTFNTVLLNTPDGAIKNAYTPAYVDEGNLFHLRSRLSSIYRTIVALAWDHALPMSIKPGQALNYCYDKDTQFTVKTGQVQTANYHVRPLDGPGRKMYTCAGRLTIGINN